MEIDEKVISDQSLNKIKKALYSEGYREGLSSGRDLKFQQGFDKGYSEGFQAGFALGMHNGVLRYLKTDSSSLEKSIKEKLLSVQEVDKASRGLCVICSQEKQDNKIMDSVEKQQETRNISQITELQDKAIIEKKSQIMTSDYTSVLSPIGLDRLFKDC